ncbi:MAG TPA: VWA domain-containing protein, partial [Planctomycetota bacterium]|nr:VWA domain-containing protein [Planctomycetota bacterium]
ALGVVALELELLGRQQLELKRDYAQRVLDFLGNLAELGRALAPWRGRKQVLVFSGGFDQSTWNEVQAPTGPFARTTVPAAVLDTASIQNIRDQMRRTFRTLREADVVLHTVDVSGIQGAMDLTNQEGLGQQRGQGRETLQALSENTGGVAVRPTNDFARALGEVDAASRHYYVLAFAPPDGAGTKPRSLKVKVRAAGLSVSHRAAYTLPAPPPEGKDDVLAVAAEAIAKGLTGGALQLDLLALPYRDPRGGLSVPAVLHVDGAALAATATGAQARVQVYGYALVADQVVDALRLETTLDLAKLGPALRENGLRLLTSFAVPAAGPVDVRFFVRAGAGGTSGSV